MAAAKTLWPWTCVPYLPVCIFTNGSTLSVKISQDLIFLEIEPGYIKKVLRDINMSEANFMH